MVKPHARCPKYGPLRVSKTEAQSGRGSDVVALEKAVGQSAIIRGGHDAEVDVPLRCKLPIDDAEAAYVTGTVDQELLARNEYLAAENCILKAQLKGRLKLSDAERATLGEIGHRLGRKVLGEVANVARPDTILAWYQFDGSKARRNPRRSRISRETNGCTVSATLSLK